MLNILVVAEKQVRLTVEFIPFLCSIAPLTEVMLGLLPMSLGFLEHYKNNEKTKTKRKKCINK